MKVCNECEGLIPLNLNECPNCGSKEDLSKKSLLKKILLGISISSASLTLMACYGAPPRGNVKAQLFPNNSKEENKNLNQEIEQGIEIKKNNISISE